MVSMYISSNDPGQVINFDIYLRFTLNGSMWNKITKDKIASNR